MKFFTHGCKAWQRYAMTGHPYLGFIMRVSFFYCFLLITGITLLKASDMHGQNLDAILVTAELKNEPVTTLFRAIEKQTDLSFAFSDNHVKDLTISLPNGTRSVKATLDLALQDTPLRYRQRERSIIIYPKEEEKPDEKKTGEAPALQRPEQVKPLYAVTGKITDTNGAAIAGVNIIVKGTTNGTSSDAEGRYTINAENADILVFSFIGYKTVEEQVGGRTVVDVVMQEDAATLSEVIVNAGYWEVKDRERTGNISRVDADIISRTPSSNPLQALSGRMPGVYVEQSSGTPGSNFTVQIRGRNSISRGNNPLYVINGVPFVSETLSSTNTSAGVYQGIGSSPLNGINPDDIESIEVLKDADATAIYGSRGANGVILITTKKGNAGKVRLDVNAFSSISQVAKKLELLNTEQYLGMRKEALKNDNIPVSESDAYDLLLWDTTRYTDWQERLLGGTAKMWNAQASISGGNDQTQFLLSGGYQTQTTVYPDNDKVDRMSTLFSVNHISNDKRFSVQASTNYIVNNSDMVAVDFAYQAMTLPPNAPRLYDEYGNLNWENSTWTNPLADLERRFDSNGTNLVSNVMLGYELLPGLQAKTSIGLNNIQLQEKSFMPSTYYDPAWGLGPEFSNVTYSSASTQSFIVEPQLNWRRTYNKSDLIVMIGGTIQQQQSEHTVQSFTGFSSNALINDLNAASVIDIMSYSKSEYKYAAIYFRANYDWKSKYLINLTGRRDGSSRFGPGSRFANFGAVGAAWIFSNESFIKEYLPYISFGKLRASYGTAGNDQIGDYQYLDTYATSGVYQGIAGLVPVRLSNPGYAWETNRKFEVALEIGFIQNRINITGSYYQNRSSNQLINYTLASSTGFSSIIRNFPATVQNTGIELELNTINVENSKFRWSTSINVTFPRNKLVRFPNIESSSYANTYAIGQPLNILRRYDYLGVDSSTGIFQFEDMNGDGMLTTSDQLMYVKTGHNYYGGMNNSITFKGWQLDIFLQLVKRWGTNYFTLFNMPGGPFNIPKDILDKSWNEQRTDAETQILTTNNLPAIVAYSQYRVSDANIVDASFLRLKNISLSYQFQPKKPGVIKSRVYIQGQNLLTVTKYKGLDPESASSGTVPPLRTVALGIQVTL